MKLDDNIQLEINNSPLIKEMIETIKKQRLEITQMKQDIITLKHRQDNNVLKLQKIEEDLDYIGGK